MSRWNWDFVRSWISQSVTACTVAEWGRSITRLISPSTLGASTRAIDRELPSGALLRTSTVPVSSTKRPVAPSPSRISGAPALTLTGTRTRVICSACSSVSPLQSTARIVSRIWPAVITAHTPRSTVARPTRPMARMNAAVRKETERSCTRRARVAYASRMCRWSSPVILSSSHMNCWMFCAHSK